ncbi:MAG: RnfABCDGE type electron transport complex subunit D [Dehalococcoidia bacterium]
MSAAVASANGTSYALRKFLRTPKGLLLPVLGLLTFAGLWTAGAAGLASVAVAVTVAAAVDVALAVASRGVWEFPIAAVLSGLIVALVLAPEEPLIAVGVTSGLAIVSKQFFRTRTANVFNPAALALVVAALAFSSAQSWWGALPDLGLAGVALVLATGVYIASYVNKLPAVLAFLGLYFFLFTFGAVFGDPSRVAEVFRPPDVNAALFFACFMLDDPPTCPVRYRDQVMFGGVVASVSFMVFVVLGGVYFLLAGLLAGNLWEALRRTLQARSRAPA